MTEIVSLANVTLEPEAAEDPALPESVRGGAITIGNFDGVHLGHVSLLREVRRTADRIGGPAVVLVLDPHPAVILRPESAPTRLTWIERRAELMSAHGIDAMVVCPTTRDFLNLSAESFFQVLVVDRLRAQAMVEGPNFFFGRNRGGNLSTLRELCQVSGIELRVIEPSLVSGEMVSSTRIRQLLESGQVSQAAAMLGVPYRIRGEVVGGARRGREIGFPTANLSNIDVLIPGPGVYGGFMSSEHPTPMAAIHIGPTPTFDCDGSLKVEIHVIDYDGDLYGQSLLVDVILRVRDIARFDSVQHLAQQLNRDVEFIRNQLASSQR